MPIDQQTPQWPVDGHVHFHAVDRVGRTLAAAAANFRGASGRQDGFLGMLLLAQARSENVFEVLAREGQAPGWQLKPAANEPESLIARRGSVSLAIVCGRQVRAADGLEVLALGTRATFDDSYAFGDLLRRVHRSGALTVVPWGLGKWLGRRGLRMEKALGMFADRDVFIGDNGTRLALLGLPSKVRAARARGFRILPGTDPFPFGGDYRRVGGFGFVAAARLDETAPFQSLRAWLDTQHESPTPYGRACGPMRFVVNQAGIQVWNRLPGRRAA